MVIESTNNPKDSSTDRREAGEIDRIPGTVSKGKLVYEIRLKNHLEAHWAEWFDGWTITNVEDDEVILTCSSTDHAGLHGVLDKIRDLNLTIISVRKIPSNSGEPSKPWS